MRGYVICPVRNATVEFQKAVQDVVISVEDRCGVSLHYPPRDTDQHNDSIGTCEQNRQAILDADVILFAWDGESQGCLFDLGIAFSLNKPIVLIPGLVPETTGKSFSEFSRQYEKKSNQFVWLMTFLTDRSK